MVAQDKTVLGLLLVQVDAGRSLADLAFVDVANDRAGLGEVVL